MRKLLALLMGLVVLIAPLASVSAADIPDELWTPIENPQGQGWRSLYLGDNTTLNREPSTLYAELEVQQGTPAPTFHCVNVDSPKCVELTRIQASAFLQPCSVSIPTNCIESVYAIDRFGEIHNGRSPTIYPVSGKWDFAANDAINLPAGGSPTIWEIPGITHGGGTAQYMVQAFTNNYLEKAARTKITTEQFKTERIQVNLSPVKIIYGRYSQQVAQDSTETHAGTFRGVMHNSLDEWRFCSMVDNGSCAQRQAFPEDMRFGVKVRLQKKITGWLHGRIYNPDATIVNEPSGQQTIEVLASPIRVPVIGEWYRWADLTPAIQQYVLDGKMQGGQGDFFTKNQAIGNFQEMTGTTGQQAFDALSLWLPQIKDRASANQSTWTFYNLSAWELQSADKCISSANDLVGIVTTNALVYSAGTPSFNAQTQSLDYKVMAPHFTSKGEVFRGTYDLRIRSAVARCIYGFTAAPIQASISILAEDGSTQTATQVIDERNGWLSLSANGFTYSSPTISVKLSQKAPAPTLTPAPNPSSSPSPSPALSTCVKGKLVKKVTASRCPKGYSKRVSSTLK